MGAGADEEQVADVLAGIVRTEPGALGEHRLQPEGGAVHGRQTVAEIRRREQLRRDDLGLEARQDAGVERRGDAPAIGLGHGRPVDPAFQVGHRRQHIERVAARRRQRRIGRGRPVQVEAEILGQDLAAEDVVEQAAIARAEQDGVVVDAGIALARAEIPDEQAHREARAGQLARRPAFHYGGIEQAAIGGRRIGVGHHHLGRQRFARGEAHAGCPSVLDEDLFHRRVAPHGVALAFDQRHQPGNQLAGAADGAVHAVFALEMADEGIERGDAERVAADEQRMEAEGDPQPRVADVARHHGVDGLVGAVADEARDGAQHRHRRRERHLAEILEGEAVDLLALDEEALVAGQVAGRQAGDLGPHGGIVAGTREGGPIGEAQPVERVEGLHGHVIGQTPAAQRPELLEQERQGDDGRPGIEHEAVLPEHRGAAPGLFQLFHDGDPIATRTQADSGSEAAKAAADDYRPRAPIGGSGCFRSVENCQHE